MNYWDASSDSWEHAIIFLFKYRSWMNLSRKIRLQLQRSDSPMRENQRKRGPGFKSWQHAWSLTLRCIIEVSVSWMEKTSWEVQQVNSRFLWLAYLLAHLLHWDSLMKSPCGPSCRTAQQGEMSAAFKCSNSTGSHSPSLLLCCNRLIMNRSEKHSQATTE